MPRRRTFRCAPVLPRPGLAGLGGTSPGLAGLVVASLVLVSLALAGCAPFPRVAEHSPARVAAAPYPALLPLDAFPEATPPAPEGAAIAEALDAEAAALNARAAALRRLSSP